MATEIVGQSWEAFLPFEAFITKDDVSRMEKACKSFDVSRRLMLVVMTRSSDELLAGFAKDEDRTTGAFTQLMESIAEYKEFLEQGVALADNAYARLTAVAGTMLERKDAEQGQERPDLKLVSIDTRPDGEPRREPPLTNRELVQLRKMMDDFDRIGMECPIARRIVNPEDSA